MQSANSFQVVIGDGEGEVRNHIRNSNMFLNLG
jgi:hypothetical protein